MRKTATFLLSLFLLNLSVSCTNKNSSIFQKVNYPTKIKLNPTEVIIEPLKLSEIAKQVEYIPLQTVGGVLLANIGDDIVITDQYFFMRMNASVLKYDKEGRFIKRLFNPGRGPGEVFARSFTVDKNANLVYVYSNYEHVIKVYNYDGILIKSIKKPIDDLSHFTEGIFFFDNSLIVKTYQNQESKYLLSAFDLKTDSIRVLYKDYTHVSTLTKDPKMIQPIDAICYQNLDSIFLFKEMFCDTIFKVNNSFKTEPEFIISFNNNQLTREGLIESRNKRVNPPGYWIRSFAESRNNLFLVLRSYSDRQMFGIYNKRDSSIRLATNQNIDFFNQKVFFENDLDKIVNFNPMSGLGKLYYYNECLYSIIEAMDFAKGYKSATTETKNATDYLRKMAPIFDSINEFSNPIIMKVYLK